MVHEKNYRTHDIELVVLIIDLKLWKHYLYDAYVDLYTDHKSIKYVFTQKDFNLPLRRCFEFIEGLLHKCYLPPRQGQCVCGYSKLYGYG